MDDSFGVVVIGQIFLFEGYVVVVVEIKNLDYDKRELTIESK